MKIFKEELAVMVKNTEIKTSDRRGVLFNKMSFP